MPHLLHTPGLSDDSHLAGQIYFFDKSAVVACCWSAFFSVQTDEESFSEHFSVLVELPAHAANIMAAAANINVFFIEQ